MTILGIWFDTVAEGTNAATDLLSDTAKHKNLHFNLAKYNQVYHTKKKYCKQHFTQEADVITLQLKQWICPGVWLIKIDMSE